MKQLIHLLILLPCLLSAQEKTFSVRKDSYTYVKLPQYQPSTILLDPINTVWIDSNEWKKGVKFYLWNEEVIITGASLIGLSKGAIFKMEGDRGIIHELTCKQAFNFIADPAYTLTLEIHEVYARNKVSKANWTYILKFR